MAEILCVAVEEAIEARSGMSVLPVFLVQLIQDCRVTYAIIVRGIDATELAIRKIFLYLSAEREQWTCAVGNTRVYCVEEGAFIRVVRL